MKRGSGCYRLKTFESRRELVLSLLAVLLLFSCSDGPDNSLTVSNPASVQRNDELIVISRHDLEEKLGTLAEGKYVQVTVKDQPVVVQYDDLDGDQVWDEMALLYSFGAEESVRFSLSVADAPATVKAVVRAHVRHRRKNADDSFGPVITKDTMPLYNPPTDFSKQPLPPYLTEGPAWENDKVAFRLYFDTRNGKDIFGKRIPGMVMDTVGANRNNSYHELADWGMDVLHAGKSLGAGSLAFSWKLADGSDTLVRLGGEIVDTQIYEVVADGPVRAIFRVRYEGELNGERFHLTDEVRTWGGQYFYESKVSAKGLAPEVKLVAGFADFYDNQPGRADTAGINLFYSYGPQSENKDKLALGIAVPSVDYAGYTEIKEVDAAIQNTYCVSQTMQPGKDVFYRFYALWEKTDPRFSSAEGVKAFLQQQAFDWGTPLVKE